MLFLSRACRTRTCPGLVTRGELDERRSVEH
jgi:hypothetical protein